MALRRSAAEAALSVSARGVLAAFCATFLGVGLARFAYTPLIPAVVAADWFSPGRAAYLGAANLCGYLAGALLASRFTRTSPGAAMRGLMALASASFFASAFPAPFAWFLLWRFAAGFAGGALMALAAPLVLPLVPAERRGRASGLIFTGVGSGIAASGTIAPVLLERGLPDAWLGLGLISCLLTWAAWRGWPAAWPHSPLAARAQPPRKRLTGLFLAYALNAAGLTPHMIFLVDYVARGLGRGLEVGALQWVLFGAGALAGPLLAGRLADRIGFARALRLAFLIQAAAVALALSDDPLALAFSSVVVGAFVPGIVPLVLGRTQELAAANGSDARSAWALATAAFALGQAGAGYALSFLLDAGFAHALLFATGCGALPLALFVHLMVVERNAAGAAARGRARPPAAPAGPRPDG